MNAGDVKKTVGRALEKVSLPKGQMPRLLSDNGPLLHQWRTEGVHEEKGDGAHPGKTEPSTDPGKDRALPPLDEEYHQTGQLLSARGTQGKPQGVRGLLQQ